MEIGYVPYSPGLTNPSDRRRFPHYAALKGIRYELSSNVSDGLDVVILSSKADIVGWSSLKRGKTRIIYELIDSHLAMPDNKLWWNVLGTAKAITREIRRPVLNYRRTIELMCERADAVICSCPEQKRDLASLNDRVYDILDFNEEAGGRAKQDYEVGGTPLLVWEGLAYSVKHLRILAPVLARVGPDVRLRVVTDSSVPLLGAHYLNRDTGAVLNKLFTDFDLRPWERSSMPALVTGSDIAVIPIDLSDPVASAKPENKLMLLWRLGMPVVTSATPAYRRCMEAAGLDLVCESVDDWVGAIDSLLTSAGARKHAAEAGAQYVRAHCDTDELIRRWDQVLADVTEHKG
jgi:glycosyltransferase involved in cell wall biosynthesis